MKRCGMLRTAAEQQRPSAARSGRASAATPAAGPAYVPIEEDNPLGLEDVEAAAEEFRRMVLRLAEQEPEGRE
jgi:hypothetical protein